MKWRGEQGGGQDCRVGHVCDVSGLTSWLYQQVVHIGSSGRAAKHPCHVSLRSCRERAASVDQDSLLSDFAQPILLDEWCTNLLVQEGNAVPLHIFVSKSHILSGLLFKCLTLYLFLPWCQPGHTYPPSVCVLMSMHVFACVGTRSFCHSL